MVVPLCGPRHGVVFGVASQVMCVCAPPARGAKGLASLTPSEA
jgi:hypothetical protein